MKKISIKLPKMVRVCNAIDTTKFDKPNGMSCIEYWREQKPDIEVTTCPACHEEMQPDDIVGGHVIDFLNNPAHVYITPMHSGCNTMRQKSGTFLVNESKLVRVPVEDEKAILALNETIIKQKRESFNRLHHLRSIIHVF